MRSGKWAEHKYKKKSYPPFPRGGAHAVTRKVAQYVIDNDHSLVEYQGEDTSLGIWMDEAPFKVKLTTTDRWISHSGQCENQRALVIGHDIDVARMHSCFSRTRDSTVPSTPVARKHKLGKVPLVILVGSGRNMISRRTAIRETWAKGYDNVFFIVGAKPCPIPPDYRKPWTCEKRSRAPEHIQQQYDADMKAEQDALEREAAENPDLVLVPMIDAYVRAHLEPLRASQLTLRTT